MEEQQERGVQESFLTNLVGKEVSLNYQGSQTIGVLKEINPSAGYLFVSPVVIAEPDSEAMYFSDEGKYISLVFFNKGNPYDALSFKEGHLKRLVDSRNRKSKIGFNA